MVISLFKRIKHWVDIKLGKKRCSGYKIYPDRLYCPGCSDCKDKDKIKPYIGI